MSKKVSRRQFLTYTLGATGGFLGAGMLFPMVRFALDPVLRKEAAGKFVETTLSASDITDEPFAVDFTVKRSDGWYNPPKGEPMTAWVMKDASSPNGILALSPVCKHLGCTVNWNSNPQYKNQFFCPCHFGRYTKNGTNIPGTPPAAPLDQYTTEVKDGKLWIGDIKKA